MFLSIDAGNSNIVFGFSDKGLHHWPYELRIQTKKNLSVLEIEKIVRLFFLENSLKSSEVSQIGISSVVPEVNSTLKEFCLLYFGKSPYTINGRSYRNLEVHVQKPDEIGSDLMANVTAAFQKFQSGCIIVDFGTALTFTVVDHQGKVTGVSIVPGIKTAIHSLFANTAKLPEIKLEMPSSVLGKDTIHSIQAGIFYGYSSLIKGMVERIQQELGNPYKIIATGGLSSVMENVSPIFNSVDPHLTLKGIKLITETNLQK